MTLIGIGGGIPETQGSWINADTFKNLPVPERGRIPETPTLPEKGITMIPSYQQKVTSWPSPKN